MSANYANHQCAYCRSAPSSRTGDHIFARGFFPKDLRADLPKAPCCLDCGNAKSQLEHYLTTVLPFGSMHGTAVQNLKNMAPPRLEKNLRLKRDLAKGMGPRKHLNDGSVVIPFEIDKLRNLFSMIPLGLLWHHTRQYLPGTHSSIAFTPPDNSMRHLATHFLKLRGERVEADIGAGTFRYVANISHDEPYFSTWFFELMSGLRLTGDTDLPDAIVSGVVGITASHSSIDLIRKKWLAETA